MFPNGYPNGYPPAGPIPNGSGAPQYYVNGIRPILNGVPAGRGRWVSNRMTHPIDIEFQPMGPPRQTNPQHQPGQYHPPPMPQTHPQSHYQPMQYQPGGKHEAAQITFRQPQPVFYPQNSPHGPVKSAGITATRERKTLAIVDPTTGKNILEDMNNDKTDSNKSSESSASNTPAPSGTPPNKAEQADIAAHFAAEVAKKAAEKDTMEPETVDSVARTNKPSEASPSNVVISDSRESKDQLKNSIVNKLEHVNSETVDSGVTKSVPDSEVLKPQPKVDMTPVPSSFQGVPQAMPILTTPPNLPQIPVGIQPQPVQPPTLPQQVTQQPPLQVSPQPLVQASSQPPSQAPPQQSMQGPPPTPPQQTQQAKPPPQPQPQQQPPPPPNQAGAQIQQKQKSPSPQQSVKIQQNAQASPPPPVQQQAPPEAAPAQPPKQPPQQHLPSPPPQATPQNATTNDAEQKMENLSQLMSSVQLDVPTKPEPSVPVKQSSPKPPILPTPVVKEEEVSIPEQPSLGKRRGGGPREENAPSRENVEENSVQPVQPQKAATPPATQPPSKVVPQPVQNAKEKEKTPEPAQPVSTPTPPPPQQAPASLPPSKETSPQPATSPTLPEENDSSERSSKEREVNNVEVEVNNVHDAEKKDEDKPQLQYTYKDDQWSPVNQDGKRQYDRRFLLELQNNPLSLKKPESLPNLEVVRDGPGRHKAFDARSQFITGGGPDFTPEYVKSTVTGNKQSRTGVPRNLSQQRQGGQINQGGGGRRGQPKVIVIPLSTGRDPPKLKTTENAWKPSVMEFDPNMDEAAATEEVNKRMRGILNKLTPEKFEKLVGTVKEMPIDTTERLSAVIDLIFEKAVDEQGFSSTYASLCQVLSKMSVRGEGTDEGKSEVKFRNLIINKCQKEFEKDNLEEIKPLRMKEIEQCTDTEKKAEMKAKWDFEETKMRQRSVGNIRFIGELYKLRMLTSPIMMRIIGTLLQKRDEESLECLCKLVTTIGKILEGQCAQQAKPKEELDKHFRNMHKIISERSTNSRVRFLMMDVIELRSNNWVPRREDSKPKTKAEVHDEVKREEFEQQIALANTPSRRDDRDRDRKVGRQNRGPTMSDNEGWNTVASTKGRASFDSLRLQKTFNRPGAGEPKEVTLRGAGFGNWARGSSGGGLKDHEEVKQQENRFNVLGDSMGGGTPMSTDNRRGAPPIGRLGPGGGPPRQGGFASKSMPPPSNDKESALSAVKKFVGTDRSKSTSRPESRENSVPRENHALKGAPALGVVEAEKYAIAIIEEYAHTEDTDEAKLWIKERFSTATITQFVQFSLEWVLDRDATKRKKVGQLYHDLIIENLLTLDHFFAGVRETLSMTEDFVIDIPQVCDYFGEIFAPCLNDNAVSMQRLLEMCENANSKSATVFACIISKAATLMSQNKVADLWNSSGLSWNNIVPSNTNVDDFLSKQKVEFTVDLSKSSSTSGCSTWNSQTIEAEFLKLFKRASNAEIFDWIDANFGNDAKTSKFIRALVTALVESQAMTSKDGSSIRTAEDFEDKMKQRLPVVRKYVDSIEKLELQCLYGLQALVVKHQYPPGLLEKCFNAFYDSDVVSEEAFDEWVKANDPEEQAGKGVCVASVMSFMRWLKEAEVEETEAQG